MTPIKSPKDLPSLCDKLASERFFGNVTLFFKDGRLERMTSEQSFILPIGEKNSSAYSR